MAVPMSMTMMGAGYFSSAATASATRSAPSWLWISMRIFSPVRTPGPTIMGGLPNRRVRAFSIMKLMGGTTLEKIAPDTSFKSKPYSEKYSSGRY